ncbi:MAG: type IV pilus twitching motility protein PilT [Myxococcales bacterium]
MAVLDKYLDAMVKQRAEVLTFRAGSLVELTIGGEATPVSSRPPSTEQLTQVISEVIGGPDAFARLKGGAGSFTYRAPSGASFALTVNAAPGAMLLRVTPATAERMALAAPATPPAAAAPVVASTPAVNGTVAATMEELFHQMLDLKASDLHLKSNKAPMVRIDGGMSYLPGRAAIPAQRLEELLRTIMPERNQAEFADTNDTDFAHALGDRARLRCNIFRDIAGAGAVFRQIPSKILTAAQLGLPPAVLQLCEAETGLVVVTGPTGSGKSTTLAAMIDHINDTYDGHIITIEDPVEFVHQDKKCHINQREVGTQTKGFKPALRAALREDPDIVLVGEMRDLETVSIAIETAETGHLVFGTLHTNTAASTISRLIDQFPTDRQEQVRAMLSESLRGVVAQCLLKKKGGGRVAALEILVVTPAVSNLIRDGKVFQIPSIMQTGKSLGMQTVNDALIDLVKAGTVEAAEAYSRAPVKKEFGALLTRCGFKGPWSEEAAGGAGERSAAQHRAN